MADPQKPDPNVFWCPKCRAHGKCNRKSKSVSDGPAITTLHCKECEAKGGMPLKFRDECIELAKICMGVSIFLAVAMLVSGVDDEMGYSEIGETIGIASMSGLTIWIWLTGSKYITWLKWKKWAKERGWEGEKPYGK